MFYSRHRYRLIDHLEGFGPNLIALPSSPRNSLIGQLEVDTPSSLARTEAGRASHARSWSVWTAPSPSQAFAFRSPTLPCLPGSASWELDPQTPEPPLSHARTDSSAYYTALWGSPHERQSSFQTTSERVYHQRVANEVSTDGSPTLHRKSSKARTTTTGTAQACGTTQERDQAGFYTSRALSRSLSGTARNREERRPRYGFTEDWLQNNLTRHKVSERGNWWSDESDGQSVGTTELEPLGREEAWVESVEAIKQEKSFQRRSSVADQRAPIKRVPTTSPHHPRQHRAWVSDTTVNTPRSGSTVENRRVAPQSQSKWPTRLLHRLVCPLRVGLAQTARYLHLRLALSAQHRNHQCSLW